MNLRTRYRRLRSQGTLGYARRALGSRKLLLAALRKHAEIMQGTISALDLSFATKFLSVYLFVKVNEMVNEGKTNSGFIDQKMFKTAGKYGFYSLYLTETSMQVLDGYINHIHPLLKPNCDYVLVTRNGGQHNKLGELMSKLVFDTTGKYVHPTR